MIIGGSAASVAAVESIRKRDRTNSICVISEEPYVPYSRPMISELLSEEVNLKRLSYKGSDFWDRKKVERVFGVSAIRVDPKAHVVELEDGRELHYDKLLIATGGRLFIPKIEGLEYGGVYTFTKIEDAQKLSKLLEKVNRIVVIGAGLIGVSVTESLVKKGKKVTIVELKERILSQILDKTASKIFENEVRGAGADVVTEHTVVEIIPNKDRDLVSGVILDDGFVIKCELVLITIGVIPETGLIKDSGLKVNRGVIVDDYMQTSIPDIYACGDAAETYDFVLRENRSLQLWPVARLTGRVAGMNISGQDKRYEGATMMCSLRYFKTPTVSMGIPNLDRKEEVQVYRFHDKKSGVYKKIVFREDHLIGMIFINDIQRSGIIFYLMRKGEQLRRFRKPLIREDLGLINLPKRMREEILRV